MLQLPQNKVIKMQTFARFFYFGPRDLRTVHSHLQGHYRVLQSALEFKLQFVVVIKSQLAKLCLSHRDTVSRPNHSFTEYGRRRILGRRTLSSTFLDHDVVRFSETSVSECPSATLR